MAVTEEYVIDQLKSLTDLYADIESTLMVNVAKRFNANDKLGGTDAWRIERISELSALRNENIAYIKANTKSIEKYLTVAYNNIVYESLKNDEAIYNAAIESGINTLTRPLKLAKSSNLVRKVLDAEIKNSLSVLNLTNTTAIESANAEFLRIINKTFVMVDQGILDYNTAIRIATNELADKGITGQTYIRKDGVKVNMPLDSAVKREVLTSSQQTARKSQDERAKEWGSDLWEISSHMGARPKCAPFQGQIYSQSGKSKKYKPISSTSIGDPAGLFGINCHHQKYVFIDGFSRQTFFPYDEEENAKAYQQSQQENYIKNQRKKKRLRKKLEKLQ